MATERPAHVLHGRRDEREQLTRLLEAVRGGESRVLVMTGEPGVGKTALLESALASPSGFRVVRAAGVESEMELAFAVLQQLCAPMLDRLEELPAPQRDALGVAFGLTAGDAPDTFLVALAVLNLMSETARAQPLACIVDDAQWLDRASAQALVFVARRLLAESVALVFATRDAGDGLDGFPTLALEGLPDGDARALLGSALRVPLDEQVRERLIAETRGNPLALLELPGALTPVELAGGFGSLAAPGLSGHIEESFGRRLARLPDETRRLLLLAAAEPVGDPMLMWRAAQRLGIAVEAAAETDGLLTIDTRVTFRHPLVRSSVYRTAAPEDRQAVHRALADTTDPDVDPDRRAWHLAQATQGFDETVASELERSAARARGRGGLAAAAAFMERATALTFDPSRRAQRALAAARAKHLAGAFDAALELLGVAESGPLDELQRAEIDLLRGQVEFAWNPGSGDVAPSLLKAANRFEAFDERRARDTYLEALTAVLFAGRMASAGSLSETAQAAASAPRPSRSPRAPDLLLDGLAQVIIEGHAAGTPALKRAVSAVRGEDIPREHAYRWLWLGCRAAAIVWDDQAWDELSARLVQIARDTGALSMLPLALTHRCGPHLFAGEFAIVASIVEEIAAVNEATGTRLAPYGALALVALQGREAEASELTEAAGTELLARGEGQGLTIVDWSTAVLCNGLGRYGDALAAAQRAGEDSPATWFRNWALVELVEAGARSGKSELAADALGRLSQTISASGTDWAGGLEARSRALLSDNEAAEHLYRAAIDRLGRTRYRVELARAHLVYGEWLRRERRRLDAREQLRRAHDLFSEFGMEGFAERTRIELEATGEHARKRTAATRDDLTPQEAQICSTAAGGATNQDIAAQLFISPGTVEYHLRKAFRKLGINSRHQLQEHVLHRGAQVEPRARAR